MGALGSRGGVYIFYIANHDDPAILPRYLTGGWVTYAQTAELGPWQLVFLNTHRPGWDGGRLGSQRRAELATTLELRPDRHTLIVLHHPPVSIASPWMDAMGLQDAAEFFAITDRHPQIRAIVWGHIHQEFAQRRDGVWLWATPSTCVQFKPGATRYERDHLAPGYRCLDLYPDGSIATTVIRVPN